MRCVGGLVVEVFGSNDWLDDFGDWLCNDLLNNLHVQRFTTNGGLESVDIISGVVDNSSETIRVVQFV